MTTPVDELPNDVAALKALVREERSARIAKECALASAHTQIAKLEELVARLQRAQFGPRSERRRAEQPGQGLFVFPEMLEAAQRVADETGAVGTIEIQGSTRKRTGRRSRFPAHLPRVRTTYELPEDQRQCCGQPLVEMGEDVTRQLERIETTLVHEIARTKYACRTCETCRTAPGPSRPIDKGLLGPGFLAHVAVERFARHMPYHRLEKKYASEGLSLSRSVLCRSTLRLAELLEPIVEQMKAEVLASDVIQTDDTPVRIQTSSAGGPKTGHAWIYKDLDSRCVYDFTESRSRDGPIAFLGDYRGYLQADAYAGYDVFFAPGGATEVACWAHVRRRFVEAEATDPALSQRALAEIRALYAIERRARDLGLDRHAVTALRREEARPILDRLRDALGLWQGQVLDKSPMGRAISYALAQWTALTRYVEDGRIPIDNNGAENALRGIAVGRKNWLFVGHEEAGKKGAVLLSLIRTCETLGVDPKTYLGDVMTRIAVETDVTRLTPHGWKVHFSNEIAARHDAVLHALAAGRALDV